jgi:chitinase
MLLSFSGKLLTLSLGGAGGAYGFQSDAEGVAFANTVWNLFLGGSSSTRPFGSAVLDGWVYLAFGRLFILIIAC